MRAGGQVLVLLVVASCRLHFDDQPVGGARDVDGTVDVPDALTCGYRCTFDPLAGTNTCGAPVTATISTPSDQQTAVIDLTGFSELVLVADLCDPVGYTLHVGDSPSNDGFGGDGGQTSNDAEVQLVEQQMDLFANDGGAAALIGSAPGIVAATGCTSLAGTLRDGSVMFAAATTLDVTSPTALRLNPPTDTEGTPDALWYLGVNRMYGNPTRTGTGLRSLDVCIR